MRAPAKTQSTIFPKQVGRIGFLKISTGVLLSIYLTIPFAILIIITDKAGLNLTFLKTTQALDYQKLTLFTLLFTLPHILASFFGFFDKEYVNFYGKKLLRGAQYATFAAILIPIINIQLAFFAFALFTMYHVFRQQSGIAKSLMRGSNNYHKYWEWCGILLSFALYLTIYATSIAPKYLVVIWLICLLPFTIFAILAARASNNSMGKLYLGATHAIPIASGIFFLLGYPILSIVVPRIIHDLTGYVFYISHDNNRYIEKQTNLIYKYLSVTKIPVILLCPLLSISLALVIQRSLFADIYIILTALFLFHYFNESYMWKRGSLHRNYIRFAS